VDEAIRLRQAMEAFLRQDMHLGQAEAQSRADLRQLLQA
jgi:flagellar biosynthesis/type III secretory pathway ATPase